MSIPDKLTQIAEDISSEIERANDTTSESDSTLHDAVTSLIEGYGQGGIERNNVTWHQCPAAVKSYLDNVTYDPSDYTTSEIATYAPGTAVMSNTKPVGKTVEGVTYYDNVPNTETVYVGETQCGYVKPLDDLRWINTATDNVRDLGGWDCDGGKVKYGKLFRGAEINTADTNLLVNEIGIRRELNLRGNETSETVSVLGEGIYFYRPPTFTQYTLSNTYMKETLEFIFDGVMRSEPIYFHCHYGADRTGTVACIIEALLGMSQSDIDKDYELTSFYSGTWHDNVARRRNETEWTGLINEIKAVPLSGGLPDSFRNRVISYVVSLGITVDTLNNFRSAMINGNPEPIIPVESLLDMDRIVLGSNNASWKVDGEYVYPPQDDYVFASFNVRTGVYQQSSTSNNIITDVSENSVSITHSASLNGCMYSVPLENNTQYKLSWTAAGNPRVYVAWYADGSFDAKSTRESIDNNTGNRTYTFTTPASGTIIGAIMFGAGGNSDAQFTNVKLEEV